jgi:hypothetical protein
VLERVAFPKKSSEDTLNPLNNKVRNNKHTGLIYLDGEENEFD